MCISIYLNGRKIDHDKSNLFSEPDFFIKTAQGTTYRADFSFAFRNKQYLPEQGGSNFALKISEI